MSSTSCAEKCRVNVFCNPNARNAKTEAPLEIAQYINSAFQSCRARTKAPPNHNATRGDANDQNASQIDTSTLTLRREVGDGTAIFANSSYSKQTPVGARNVPVQSSCCLHGP